MGNLEKQAFSYRHTGFTLIEIAIVLVIIGLLLGGVLKGQELINNAKVKSHINELKSVSLLVYAYQDKYKALPGDDAAAKTHLGVEATLMPTSATLGNGKIEGNYNSVAATDESLAFWQQVRLANLASGPTDFSGPDKIAASAPHNADGGRIGIQSATPISSMTGAYFVCSDGIQGKLAKQIDISMDDGDTETGSVRTMPAGYSGTAQKAVSMTGDNAIQDNTPYTVCVAF